MSAPDSLTSESGTVRIRFAYALVTLAWLAVRVWVFSHGTETEYPDSFSYLDKAMSPLWTSAFFFGDGRFFIVPLLYKTAALLGPSKNYLTAAQLGLSLVAWLLFAWAASAPVARRWLGVASLAAVLTLALMPDVLEWDTIILSESVATSVFVVLVAVCLRFGEGPTAARALYLLAVFAVFSMSREANSLLLLPIGVALVCWSLWYLRRRLQQIQCWGLALAALVLVFVTFSISGQGERWVFPLLNVVGKRILPVPERARFYEARGMPVNAALMEMSGEFASGKKWAFYSSPDLAAFRMWLRSSGRKAYAEDLLRHPMRSLEEPLLDVQEFVCPELSPYWSPGFTPVLPYLGPSRCPRQLAIGIVAGTFIIGIILYLVAYFWRRKLSEANGFWLLLIAGMLVSWQPFVWMTWHIIGGMEVGRHSFSGILESRVGFLLLILYVARRIGFTPPGSMHAEIVAEKL
jgi:hypothetical protein